MVPDYHDPNDKLLAPRIVAQRLGVHCETIYRWIRSGYIRFVSLGPRRKFIRESEVRRVLEDRRSTAA